MTNTTRRSTDSPSSILKRWKVTPEELTVAVDRNPSLRGMLLGYLAEEQLEKFWLSGPLVSDVRKDDDHNRKKKGDRSVVYQGFRFVFECKSLQTAYNKKTIHGWAGKAQVDSSDSSKVRLPDGSSMATVCLVRGGFDILAVNLFTFEDKWRFVFAKNADLPAARHRKFTEYQRRHLLATLVDVHWPPRPPFSSEPFSLMNEIIRMRT